MRVAPGKEGTLNEKKRPFHLFHNSRRLPFSLRLKPRCFASSAYLAFLRSFLYRTRAAIAVPALPAAPVSLSGE